MSQKSAQRRLAAILVADVVGFSRLMEADEGGTLAALKERRKRIVEPLVRENGGRIVKFMGDGVLVEFGSAVNAVNFALDLQKQMVEANEKLPDPKQIVLRIGVNIGEVVGEGSDIFGDGVNIAARLEGLAEPGGICISGKVHDEIRGKLDFSAEDMGEIALKNVVRPVRAWMLKLAITKPEVPSAAAASRAKLSIAVLPFVNMSGDADQQFFSDGITEDIITELSRFRQLHVRARNSSFRFRGTDLDMLRVGRELGVQFLVEGSVRRVGERVRVTVQLIDAATGNHVWADKYDRLIDEIFAVQDQIVQTIVSTLGGRVVAYGAEHVRQKQPSSLAAYEYVLKANALDWETQGAKLEAQHMLNSALELDPSYATAHALLASLIVRQAVDHDRVTHSELDRALVHAKRALELDENDSACHSIVGWIYLARGSFELAAEFINRALSLNPNNPYAMINMASLLWQSSNPDEAVGWIERLREVDPYFNPSWCLEELAFAKFTAHRYEEALATLSRIMRKPFAVYSLEAACCAKLGRDAEARAAVARVKEVRQDCSIQIVLALAPYRLASDREHFVDGLRKAGLPE